MPAKKHAVEPVKTTMDIDESIDVHEKGWVIQRIGWIFILGIMLVGILGMFGEGPISNREASSGNIKATYERYFRYEAEMKILIESSSDHISSISFPQHYLKNFKLIRFVPEPQQNVTSSTDVIYQYLPSHNRIVTIYLTPKNLGSQEANMKINGVHSILLHHFIYP